MKSPPLPICYARPGLHGLEGGQLLAEHLRGVSKRAGRFTSKFGAELWGDLAGLWHDLGKFAPAFQQMLADVCVGKKKQLVDHSTAGAVLAVECLGAERGMALAFAIAGHHAGLAELRSLHERLKTKCELLKDAKAQADPGFLQVSGGELSMPKWVQRGDDRASHRSLELFIRMLFSALVDADRLDAEAWLNAQLSPQLTRETIQADTPSLGSLSQRLEAFLDARFGGEIEGARPETQAVQEYRAAVLRACRSAAFLPPGVFTLTVGTGGGKTLSSLSFALRHAREHGLDRVIVAIPYTTIIEQTARVFREALGPLGEVGVLEHHSALDLEARLKEERLRATEADQEWLALRQRLATENWDSPVVVTTNVQLFESLFSNRPGQCRKLHNVARSVVVLDEVQTLPPQLLFPICDGLNELAKNYGCSIVLTTATQPALTGDPSPGFPRLEGGREIFSSTVLGSPTPKAPDRVRVEWLGDRDSPFTYERLAQEISTGGEEQFLAIVHLRKDAAALTRLLDDRFGDTEVIHLSALMCAAHREQVVGDIRQRLASGERCRVVSTQLVEAGVDIDFPVVYRAFGGIDAMAQAAGRCNREGKLGTKGGLLRLFLAETNPPPGMPAAALTCATSLLHDREVTEELVFSPTVIEQYFRRLQRDATSAGSKGGAVQSLREALNYPEVARSFSMIDDAGFPVVVPFNEEARARVDALRAGATEPGFRLGSHLRRLQRFSVGVYERDLRLLIAAGVLVPLVAAATEGPWTLSPTHLPAYSLRFGLSLDPDCPADPGALVV